MKQTFFDRFAGTSFILSILTKIISFVDLSILSLNHDVEIINLMKKTIKEEQPFVMKPSELFIVYTLAKSQVIIEGDYAEVGVYKGTTAKMICEAKGEKSLFLFDTFDGLPEDDKVDKRFKKNMYKSDYYQVVKRLKKYKNVFIYKGMFPQTSYDIIKNKFAFVNLDVDLYKSTKDSLNFFYSRMNKYGIILSHDYQTFSVRKAFDEFFQNKLEKPIELSTSQCIIIKR
jgi:hypothetical protein